MDVFVAIFFGLFGYFARRHGYPLISLVIGLILGKLAEGSFHQALMISDHDYSVFFLRPLSATIFAICLALVLWPGAKKRLGRGGAEVLKDDPAKWGAFRKRRLLRTDRAHALKIKSSVS
jgi:TctA family transporter